METSVTDLLRNFPRVRRAAFAGQRVIIRTREGNLVLTAERPGGSSLFGALRDVVRSKGLSAGDSGAPAEDWAPSL